ncbi:MAG TPA: hypothetical protein VKN99_09570 [Polyangia bacterium]|nr:hypothetical protein [Polyangia bacterium]
MMKQAARPSERHLIGFITERHLVQAEREFPGIGRFFLECQPAPETFLDLLFRFQTTRGPGT